MKTTRPNICSISNFFQTAIFDRLIFARVRLKKIRNRAGYSSFFLTSPAQKSSRPKPSILKKLGYRWRWLWFLLTLPGAYAEATTLHALDIKYTPVKTSVFCTLTQLPSYKTFTLDNPARAVIDFQHTTARIELNKIRPGQGLIQHVRIGHPDKTTLRLVLELSQAVTITMQDWHPNIRGIQGVQIDLRPKKQINDHSPSTRHQAITQPIPMTTKTQASRPITATHAPTRNGRDIIIVIDAGHGGKDPGAKGPRQNVEKNVVLSIALKLKQLINNQPGMRAVMTRDGDYYIGLRERLNITRRYNADMFVSIHADAFINRNSNGASVYALSPRGATSEAARWLAEKENYSELGGVDLSGLDDQNRLIRTVLLDLSQTATIGASLQIGDHVLRHLDQMTTLHHNKVEQAGFMVLKSPDIPSILVETGFISNPREEFNLTSPAYQSRLTVAIFNGIKRYFWDHPPQGSRLEAMSGGNTLLNQSAPLAKSVHPAAPSHKHWPLFHSRRAAS